jgi:hypothetical protein
MVALLLFKSDKRVLMVAWTCFPWWDCATYELSCYCLGWLSLLWDYFNFAFIAGKLLSFRALTIFC